MLKGENQYLNYGYYPVQWICTYIFRIMRDEVDTNSFIYLCSYLFAHCDAHLFFWKYIYGLIDGHTFWLLGLIFVGLRSTQITFSQRRRECNQIWRSLKLHIDGRNKGLNKKMSNPPIIYMYVWFLKQQIHQNVGKQGINLDLSFIWVTYDFSRFIGKTLTEDSGSKQVLLIIWRSCCIHTHWEEHMDCHISSL